MADTGEPGGREPTAEYEEALDLWRAEDFDPAYRWEPWKVAFNAGAAWGRENARDSRSSPVSGSPVGDVRQEETKR